MFERTTMDCRWWDVTAHVNGTGVGAVEHQYVDQIGMVYAGRDVKRRLSIRGFRIHIGPVPQKKIDNIPVPQKKIAAK
jgi:hypothetical protein